MNDMATDSWIVAATHPNKERLAVDNLQRQGFRPYCPRIRKRIRHARQVRVALRPLFPGYVFIRLDPHLEQWRSIASTFGIRSLIRFGERPGTVPAQFVSDLLATEEEGAVALPRARDRYQAGEKVRVQQGPFEGLIATVLSASECDRITVLMDLLRQSVKVRIAINEVVPA